MKAAVLKTFDLFPKTDDDVRVKTASGASVSVISAVVMVILFLSELREYLSPYTSERLTVDSSFGETIPIHLNVTFPGSSCNAVYFDVVDNFGEEQMDVSETVKKIQVGERSCRMEGYLEVNKVAGNFHFALGKGVPNTAVGAEGVASHNIAGKVGAQHQHTFHFHELQEFNASHTIHQIWFGDPYPGMKKLPLDGMVKQVPSGIAQYNYYIQMVPTRYIKPNGQVIATNQYSVTEKPVEVDDTSSAFPHPGCFFFYDISPLMVLITEHDKSFGHFLTRVCAIVGGVFVAFGLLDSFIYHATKTHSA
eukprot:GFYU01011637.1.p1 GENE.GFYU01011637.1~~GFYU01011637.1.p1  ORF type:complete len:307 (-),score=91.89 GFYU01011637.1:198-1118(-)